MKHSILGLFLFFALHFSGMAQTSLLSPLKSFYTKCELFFTNNFPPFSSIHYEMNRGWKSYKSPKLENRILTLAPGAHVLDAGAGTGQAAREIARKFSNKSIYVTAVSADLVWLQWSGLWTQRIEILPLFKNSSFEKESHQRYRYIYGSLLEDIPSEDIASVDIIIDHYGAISYTKNLSELLLKYLELLKTNGSVFISGGQVGDMTEIESPNGIKSLIEFLREDLTDFFDYEFDLHSGIILTKKGTGNIEQFPKLRLDSYEKKSLPPRRKFYIK